MCFSTSASFVAGTVLASIGVVAVRKVEHKQQLVFACIPFIFAIQQFAEGFVWISLLKPYDIFWQHFYMYVFLLFAFVLWPSYVSYSVYLMEKNGLRKRILKMIFFIGCAYSIFAMNDLLYNYTTVAISDYHVRYELNLPVDWKSPLAIWYAIPTILSLFISSIRKIILMGVIVLASYFLTKILFHEYVISIWCFFSALISIMIYQILGSVEHQSEMNSIKK